MAKSQRGKPRVNVRFADDIIEKLEKIAAEKDESLSYIIRQAVSDFLVKEERETGACDTHKDIRYESAEERKKAKK
jgi:predicted transcriptional regulator